MTTFTPPTIEELQDKFPQYSIEGFIAQGGMGAVYLARQISLDRPVAIKILPTEFGEDADYRASFETEAKAMARLNHTNLVGIYDFGEINGMLYIVMEYIPGRTLFDTCNGQQVDQKEAARLISDMSEGLAHAHEAGMLHRDIKPANVLIDDQAKPKIVDFGLARPMGEEHSAGVVFGTPGYTAPEVLNNPYAVDHRSDIFSMGVMLYELLTGHLPGTPVIPVSQASNSDPRFDAIIAKSIHPNPAMRYGDADKLSKDLDALIENFDTPQSAFATRPAMASAASPLAGSVAGFSGAAGTTVLPSAKKSNAGLIVVILLLVVGGAVAMMVSRSKSAPEGPSAEEIARVAAAKKIEEQRKRELEAERKRYAEKQRQKKKAEQEEAREQARLEKLEAAKQKRLEEQAKREKAKQKREEMAAREAARLALENAKKELVSEFEVDDFVDELIEQMRVKIDGLEPKAADLLDPVYDKLERELKRLVRGFDRGRRGDIAKEMLERYMEGVRESNEITDFPNNVPFELREEGNEILDEYRVTSEEALEPLDKDKEKFRQEYIGLLNAKKAELLKLTDKIGAASLDAPIEAVNTLEGFMGLFDDGFAGLSEKERARKARIEERRNRINR